TELNRIDAICVRAKAHLHLRSLQSKPVQVRAGGISDEIAGLGAPEDLQEFKHAFLISAGGNGLGYLPGIIRSTAQLEGTLPRSHLDVIEFARGELKKGRGAPVVCISGQCVEQSWAYQNDIAG